MQDNSESFHLSSVGHAGIVERLLLEELDINEKTEGGGMTPIYFAVKHGNLEIVSENKCGKSERFFITHVSLTQATTES